MPRPRSNDPIGVSDHPLCVDDPAREAALTSEFKTRLAYIRSSYVQAVELVGDDTCYNRSLNRLRAAVLHPTSKRARGERLHPNIELIISHRARQHAEQRTGVSDTPVTQEDINFAAKHAAETLSLRGGRPEAAILRHHVEGLMALVQEVSGKPVRAGRHKNNHYDPHFADDVSQIIPGFFKAIDNGISKTPLVNIVVSARRKYAGNPMRFLDFFPAYGGMIDQEGTLTLVPGLRVEQFEPGFPIYCP